MIPSPAPSHQQYGSTWLLHVSTTSQISQQVTSPHAAARSSHRIGGRGGPAPDRGAPASEDLTAYRVAWCGSCVSRRRGRPRRPMARLGEYRLLPLEGYL